MLGLITDRTQADVDAWKAGGTNTKGEYKFTDLNRVGTALHTLSTELDACGISAPVTARTDWERTSTYTLTDLDPYLDDARTMHATLSVSAETPDVSATAQHLTWNRANDIE